MIENEVVWFCKVNLSYDTPTYKQFRTNQLKPLAADLKFLLDKIDVTNNFQIILFYVLIQTFFFRQFTLAIKYTEELD